jgi:hypothetical protein
MHKKYDHQPKYILYGLIFVGHAVIENMSIKSTAHNQNLESNAGVSRT